MVGLGRVELPTSRLSGVRSNHLSYEPDEVFSMKPHARSHEVAERKGNVGGGKAPIV